MVNLDIFLLDYEIDKANPKWWLEIIETFLKPGLKFKLSLEKEQNNILEKFTNYDKVLKITIEKNLIYLEGILNSKMINDFKASYKVIDDGGTDYYSPFISLEIADNFCSAHHGSEIYLSVLNDDELKNVFELVKPLKKYLKIGFS